MGYIDHCQSIAASCGQDVKKVIDALAGRFMQENPPAPYVWRTFDEGGIQSDSKAGYHFDFDVRFPNAGVGDTALALGDLFCPRAKKSRFILRCKCPVTIDLNGERVFTSQGNKERSGEGDIFFVSLKEGFNRFVIRVEKTRIGFSCVLQNAMPQWEPCCYVTPFENRRGEAGWLYTLIPQDGEIDAGALWGDEEFIPFLPEKKETPLREKGEFAGLAIFDWPGDGAVSWEKPEHVTLLVDGQDAFRPLSKGTHQLQMRGALEDLEKVSAPQVSLRPPVPVQGRCTPYLVLGPLTEEKIVPLGRVYHGKEDTAWRPALSGMALRPYVENFLFSKWTYPLGVTLYGMLKAGQHLDRPALTEYVHHHVQQVCGVQEYAEYEKEKYGFPGVNQQICWLDALDDCGSFGALMLRCDPAGKNADIRRLAEKIGHYMMQEQPRTEEGAFCRRDQTIWADDMYMSVPFLCRYSELTGDGAPLSFAAEQMLHYKRLLFMPDQKVMAHMRCLIHNQNNGIPWSRGNGWVIFSLSELLMVLPEDHPNRQPLLQFFRELTEGYLKLQDGCGLWHQVLNDQESYLETSATAMMICAFSRGCRFGWYEDELARQARSAAEKAWQGLTELAIDQEGNLYGVCQGSGFSFSRNYYRALSWNFNDTHGIGIVMLAGVELTL